jgi:threonine dehydratase
MVFFVGCLQANVDGSALMSVAELARAVRLLALRQHLVVEGAGAAAVAVAMAGRVGARAGEKVVCVVSGGHIDAAVLAEILSGVEEWGIDDTPVAVARR